MHELVMRSLTCCGLLALPLDPAPVCLGSAKRLFGGVEQVERFAVEVAVSPGGDEVLVRRQSRSR